MYKRMVIAYAPNPARIYDIDTTVAYINGRQLIARRNHSNKGSAHIAEFGLRQRRRIYAFIRVINRLAQLSLFIRKLIFV